MLTLKLGFRNIFRNKRRTIFTLLSMIVSFLLASVSIGWSDGSYGNIIDKFTRNIMGHIQIHNKSYVDNPSLYKTIDNPDKIIKVLKEDNRIENWSMRVYASGLGAGEEKSAGIRITGVDFKREDKVFHFGNKIVKGKIPENNKEVSIGKGLAKILRMKVGDSIVVLSQAADGSIANDRYKVVSIIDSGDEIIDRMSVYMNIDEARELFVLDNRIHEIAVVLKDRNDVDIVKNSLNKKINDKSVLVEKWQEFAKEFYRAMKADQAGMWYTLFIIILIVAITILNTVLMSVLERTREFGLLKALGTKPSKIVKMVIVEVLILSFIAIIIGSILSFGANSFLETHGYKIPEPFTYGGVKFEYMKGEVNLRTFVIPMITVIVSAFIVGIIPAIRASKIEPAKSMRFH